MVSKSKVKSKSKDRSISPQRPLHQISQYSKDGRNIQLRAKISPKINISMKLHPKSFTKLFKSSRLNHSTLKENSRNASPAQFEQITFGQIPKQKAKQINKTFRIPYP